MSVLDVDALLSAVKRLGVTAPIFLDGERVSITEQDVMRLAGREAAVAELIEADSEFDRERAGYNPLFADRDRLDSYQAAEARRAAALARCGGAK